MKRKREKKNKSGKCGANGMKNSVQISGFRRNGNPTPKFQNFCSVCALHKTLLKKQKRISDHVQGSNSSGVLKRDSIQRLMQSRQTKAKPSPPLLFIYYQNPSLYLQTQFKFSLISPSLFLSLHSYGDLLLPLDLLFSIQGQGQFFFFLFFFVKSNFFMI